MHTLCNTIATPCTCTLVHMHTGACTQVRSAKHMVVGLSADSGCVHDYNLGRLRSLLYQCLYNGTTSNASECVA